MQQQEMKIDSNDSQSNTFSMKLLTNTTAKTVIVDFTPLLILIPQQRLVKSHPIFNNDRNYFTPSFMLHQDKLCVSNSLETFLTLHTKKTEETMQEKDQMLVPRPSQVNNLCCVCKQTYDDYLTHIEQQTHLNNLSKNAFKKDIHELCWRMNKEQKKERVVKNKQIKKKSWKNAN